MKTADQLVQEIREAFADVPFPSHLGLHAAVAKDDWIADETALREITRQKDYNGDWWDVPLEHLLSCMMALSYIDAAGIDFYLPAYMTAIVATPQAFDSRNRSSAWQITYTMKPDSLEDDQDESTGLRQYFYERFSNILGARKLACLSFLHYVASCSEYHDHARDIAAEALGDEFWSSMAGDTV